MHAERKASRQFIRRFIENELDKEMRYYSPDDMTIVFMAVNDRDDDEGDDGSSRKLAESRGLVW